MPNRLLDSYGRHDMGLGTGIIFNGVNTDAGGTRTPFRNTALNPYSSNQ